MATTTFTAAQLGDIDEITDGRCPWRPVRHHFGITSFGVNAWTAQEAGGRLINEHDEADDENEELYFVHTGRARFEIDGETLDAPAGTFVFVRPAATRTAFAEEPGTTLLALGGVPGKAYTPNGWELWAPLRPLHEAGDYEAVIAGLRDVIADNPPFATLYYNLACCEALTGRTEDAIAHLRRAIELYDACRSFAENDSDFDSIRDEPAFKELLAD